MRPQTILLVDDDRSFREEMAELLEDYRVIGAATGEEALAILGRPHSVDLVLLDVMMPGRRGTDILRRIKEKSRELPVVILTGHSSESVAIEALRGDADDYLEKPLDIHRALRTIARFLRRSRGEDDLADRGAKGKVGIVKNFVERNVHKKVTLEDAAAEVCLSPKYLSRLFRAETGSGFSRYKLQVKTKAAKRLLDGTEKTVTQIAIELGYQNPESFIRIFKKLAGTTPTAYRNRAARGRGEPPRKRRARSRPCKDGKKRTPAARRRASS